MSNETITQTYENINGVNTGNLGNDTVSLSPGANSTNFYESSGNSVSSNDLGQFTPYVNGMGSNSYNLSAVDNSAYITSQSLESTQSVSSSDIKAIEEHVENMDNTLTILLFFIIFTWAELKIKNAVRSFTGVGL